MIIIISKKKKKKNCYHYHNGGNRPEHVWYINKRVLIRRASRETDNATVVYDSFQFRFRSRRLFPFRRSSLFRSELPECRSRLKRKSSFRPKVCGPRKTRIVFAYNWTNWYCCSLYCGRVYGMFAYIKFIFVFILY